jgi:DNA repair protein RadC
MEQNIFKLAEIEISYNPDYKVTDRPKINTSKRSYELLMNHWNHKKIQW